MNPSADGIGSAINDTTREVGSALGVAVLGSLFSSNFGTGVMSRLSGSGLPRGEAHALGQSLVGGSSSTGSHVHGAMAVHVHAALGGAFVHAMDITMIAAAGVVLVGAALSALLLPSRAAVSSEAPAELTPEPMPLAA
jgi:hypothetical protein